MNYADLHRKSNLLPKRDALMCLEEYSSKIKWNKYFNRILDVGCGDGSVTNLLKKFIPTDFHLLGCDISEDMVNFANDHNVNKQTSFMVLDIAGDLSEGIKGNFDNVFSIYAMHWINNQECAFKNIYNLLDEEGECFMIFLANIPMFDVYRGLAQNKKWSAWMKDVEQYISPYKDSQEPQKDVKNIAEKVGFVDIDVECKELSFLYEDINVFRMSMKAINPFKIPKEKYDDFMEDYFELLKEMKVVEKHDKDYVKGATIHYDLLVFHARKSSKIHV